MYKVWYLGTKKNDINIILSASKTNYSEFGIEKIKNGFKIHLWKCHIEYTKYLHETSKL